MKSLENKMKDEKSVIKWMDKSFIQREKDSTKGENGVIGVVGGSKNYISTPSIVGIGALRSGADLVKIVSNVKSVEVACNHKKGFLTSRIDKYDGNIQEIVEEISGCTSMVIGNGTTKNPETIETLLEVLKSSDLPVVIDADMLTTRLKDLDFEGRKVVLTPHVKEFERLYEEVEGDLAAIKEKVKKAARVYQSTIVLKGEKDVISDGKTVFVNETGCPYLSKGGTGDLLAGVLARFLSETNGLKSSCLATYLIGKSGEKAFDDIGPGFSLEELGKKVSIVLKEDFDL